MEPKNKKKFLAILYATLSVVAIVWIATEPPHTKVAIETASTTIPTMPVATVIPLAPKAPAKLLSNTPAEVRVPKQPVAPVVVQKEAAPPPVTTEMGIPALKVEEKISTLTMPDILPPTADTKHVDPRIAATVLTSGDEFDRILNGAASFLISIFNR